MFLVLVALGIIAGFDIPPLIKAKDLAGLLVFGILFISTLIFSFLIHYEINIQSTIDVISNFFKSIGLSYS